MLGVGLPFLVNRKKGGAPAAWAPPDASVGTKLWYRADMGLTEAGGLVSAWNDQSGLADAGRDQTAAGANRPIFNATDAAYGNKPTVQFDGSMRMLSGTFSASIAAPVCVVMIGQITSDSAAFSDGVDDNMIFKSGGNVYFYGAAQGPNTFGAADVTSPCCLMYSDDGSGDVDAGKLYYNDTSTPIATAVTNWGSTTELHIGLDAAAVGKLVGKHAEIIVFGGIPTAPDIANLVTYLNTTRAYGIAVT